MEIKIAKQIIKSVKDDGCQKHAWKMTTENMTTMW